MLALLLTFSATCANAQETPQSNAPTPAPEASPQTGAGEQPSGEAAPREDKATVYIYRTKKLVGGALEPSVFCDGVELARMDNGRYLVLKLEPGEHRVHMTDKSKRVDFKLGGGETAYVRVKIEPGMWKGGGNVYLTNDEDALKEIKSLKPLNADKIKDHTLVTAEQSAPKGITQKKP